MDDEDDDSDDWNEVEEIDQPLVVCLFCPRGFGAVSDAITHCKKDHLFDLHKLRTRFNMDCFSFIKLVNYIRIHHPEPSVLMDSMEIVWEGEEYMKPVHEDDPWLMFDIDDLEVSFPNISIGNNGFHVVNAENGCVTLSEHHFAELQRTIQTLTVQVQEKDAVLEGVLQDMEVMRGATRHLLSSSKCSESAEPLLERGVKVLTGKPNGMRPLGRPRDRREDIIRIDLKEIGYNEDHVRTDSYRKAILENQATMAGKSVLDLGCGTGILSMFAASAGALHVVGIDQSDIIYHAMDIIRENHLSSKVQLVKGRLEDTNLPIEKVDVIVSEWMGYFLLFEGMLDSVIYARDHYLSPGGLLLPNRCSISLLGVADLVRYGELVGFWSDVYGYRMSCLQREVVREPMVEVISEEKVVTDTCLLTQLDLYTCTIDSVDFTADFELRVTQDDTLTALAGFFDVFFDLPCHVSFTTGPHKPPTHWKQTIFFLDEPIPVKLGEVLSGKLICQRHRKEVRSLTVTIILQGKKCKYIMS
uniref:type I protein arginine methyltransferase n=1 Tax=Timema shepardi TaxID=629360 RepID=A0A7R9AUY4_TIMSH|nr:unnamed protein product [Timema shepardi]